MKRRVAPSGGPFLCYYLVRMVQKFRLKKQELPEKDIQRDIMDYLAARRVFCWKEHSGGLPMQGGEWMMPIGLKGKSDILGLLKGGRFLAIEVKRPSGKLSLYQEEFIKNINDNGGLAFVARSIDDVIAQGI